MNRQIRRLGIALLVLYTALFVQLNVVQVIRADEYADNPNNRRRILRDFGRPRGDIISADGVVLARSVPSGGQFERKREYPEGELFAHVTGYYSFAYGADGAEQSYNDELVGRDVPITMDNVTDVLLDRDQTADVTLTMPTSVQRVARDALQGRPGSVVALDPRTGAVLALWSFPSYDPNALVVEDPAAAQAARDALAPDQPNSPLRAKSYEERFFPGSTFKVVTAAAGIARAGVDPTGTQYPSTNQYVPPQTRRPVRNFGGGTCGGNLFDILRVSCNTAFAQMGVDVGAEAMFDVATGFGFNERPPLDLARPAPSLFREPDFFDDNIPLLAQSALGQNEVQATPLQMAMVAAGVANGGRIMEPHVLAELRDADGNVLERAEPAVWKEAMRPEVAAVLRDAMVGVVSNGTATRLALPGIQVAGKTGTAQLGTDPPRSHAWIIGFAPAEQPRVAVAVIVEGQPGASEQTGGRVAAPIARAVIEEALKVTALPAAGPDQPQTDQ